MKTLKPLMFVAVGIAITCLFAFKSEEPVKEYATIEWYEGVKKDAIAIITKSDVRLYSTEQPYDVKKFVEVINLAANEGWEVVNGDINSTATKRIVYLERTKK
jgi:hypothetical protein